MNTSVQMLKETLPNVLSVFSVVYLHIPIDIVECLSVQKVALGACLTHNGLEKCNQIQRKVIAPLRVHVCNNKGILTVLEYFYSSTVFVNVGGRG